MTARVPTALLISGGGRTALNLLQRAREGSVPIDVVGAVATRADCDGVARLREAGVEVDVVARDPSAAPESMHDRLDAVLRARGAELVCLCGWLRHVRLRRHDDDGPGWSWRVLNIHPSLLPAFGGQGMHGLHVHDAVIRSGVGESGCTVHYVDDIYDHGPTIVQRRVAVRPDDTPETLAARVFAEELVAYPEAVRLVVAGGVGRPPASGPSASSARSAPSEPMRGDLP